jgi:hypothetical protein
VGPADPTAEFGPPPTKAPRPLRPPSPPREETPEARYAAATPRPPATPGAVKPCVGCRGAEEFPVPPPPLEPDGRRTVRAGDPGTGTAGEPAPWDADDPARFRFLEGSLITVTESVVFHPVRGQPVGFDGSWDARSKVDKPPFRREVRVGEESRPLLTGWIDEEDRPVRDVGAVVVSNLMPARPVAPTDAERADDLSREVVLEVGGVPFARLRPGRTMRFEPAPAALESLSMRCVNPGGARLLIFGLPG